MIALRRINGQEFILNVDFIESIESTPDTVITLTSGKKILVRNSIEDIVRKTIKYKQLTNQSFKVLQASSSESTASTAERGERSA
ncbi:MAG: flagellar FlbD family protein [Chitinispirillaceae bacterium]|nr:flagellar FlbD family protein [Chitinispirillaceae bacterium]